MTISLCKPQEVRNPKITSKYNCGNPGFIVMALKDMRFRVTSGTGDIKDEKKKKTDECFIEKKIQIIK